LADVLADAWCCLLGGYVDREPTRAFADLAGETAAFEAAKQFTSAHNRETGRISDLAGANDGIP
jgi:hypothetical protein